MKNLSVFLAVISAALFGVATPVSKILLEDLNYFPLAGLLLGLGSNYLFDFWQPDPLLGLIIVVFLFREGREMWRTDD